MKFPLSWLKSHLETQASLDTLSETLTMLGLEVDAITDPAAQLGGFVVGHVVEAGPHPDADRLKLCIVDNGSEKLQIVCGAPNARAGLKVILAQPGVRIPATGDVLKKGKVRGIESQGMMCSWRELAMGEDHDGIAELAENAPVGAPITDILFLDPVIEIGLTPNRADCLGVRGIARDLAAAGLGTLKPLPIEPVPGAFDSPIAVSIDDSQACPLFAGRFIRGVKNGDSPQWLKDWLSAIGLRPISALVDITNYFSYGFGRPLHVFDAKTLSGNITARLARPGERIAALNDKTYDLDGDMIVIADEAGPQALAGVIGGAASGCTEATTDVFLEAALFDAGRIARTGRVLAVESDARHRFERHVDPAFNIPAMELATRMIIDLCGGEASHPVIAGAEPDWHRIISFRPARVEAMSGLSLERAEMEKILTGLGCQVSAQDGMLKVVPPSWRADLNAEHDLVEEVLRVHGYDNLPIIPLPRPTMPTPILSAAQRRANFVRRDLASRGLFEAVTWSFMPSALAGLFGGLRADLILANPISADLDAMRPSILPNLIAAAGRNADRGAKDLGLFEIGPVFEGENPADQRSMAAGLRAGRSGPRHWDAAPRAVDAFDAKADLLAALNAAGLPAEAFQVVAEAPGWYHPGRSGALKQGPKVIAWFGEIHPKVLKTMDVKGPVVAFELFLDRLPTAKAKPTKARPLLKVSPFMPLERDFAFVVDRNVAADAVVRAAKGADKTLIADVAVFDVYEGEHVGAGKKSIAIAVTLQPLQHTLDEGEIEALSKKVVEAVVKATKGELRG